MSSERKISYPSLTDSVEVCEAKLKQVVVTSKRNLNSDEIKFASSQHNSSYSDDTSETKNKSSDHIKFDSSIEDITDGNMYIATVDNNICGMAYSIPHHIIIKSATVLSETSANAHICEGILDIKSQDTLKLNHTNYMSQLTSGFVVDSKYICDQNYDKKITETLIEALIHISSKRYRLFPTADTGRSETQRYRLFPTADTGRSETQRYRLFPTAEKDLGPKSSIDKPVSSNILTGYYFTSFDQLKSSIKVDVWYRPINVRVALENRYQIPIERHLIKATGTIARLDGPMGVANQVIKIYENWDMKHKMVISKTELKDFDALPWNQRRIHFTPPIKDEWKYLSSKPLEWITFSYKHKIKGIVCVRKLISVLSKNQQIRNAQLVFFESVDDDFTYDVCMNLFRYLREQEYICLYGTYTGALSENNKEIRLIRCEEKYLNFYNLDINADPKEISLLYV
jgi:hypothetical protein